MDSKDNITITDDEVLSSDTISESQEKALLEDNSNDAQVPKPKAFVLAPTKFVTDNEKSKSISKINRSETTIALIQSASTSQQTVSSNDNAVDKGVRNRSRERSKRQRNAAKQLAKVRQTDTGNDSSSTPGKRGRDSGETPPSVTHPKKNRRRNKKKGNFQLVQDPNVDNNSQQTVCSNASAAAPVPPASATLQSSGSGAAASIVSTPTAATVGNPSSDCQPKQQTEHNVIDNVPSIEQDTQGQQSYAEVANNLCVAVIDQRGSGTMTLLDQKRFDTLYTLITDKVLSQAGKNISPPNFEDTRLHSGSMRVRCADFNSRQWLEKFVPTLDKKKLWKDASLVVINFSDIPKPHKFNVFVRGLRKSAHDVFRLLETQNKGITTKSWTALACEYKNGGTSMTIGVGQESFETLRQRSNQLFCGMGKATFTLVKGCKENRNALQQNAVPARKPSGGTTAGPNATVSKNSDAGEPDPAMEVEETDASSNQN